MQLTFWDHLFQQNKTMKLPVRATYLKRCVAVFPTRQCLHWLSSSFRSRVMADHIFESHDRDFCRPR